MNCPFCNSDQIVVKNSRPSRKNTQIWRRRQCLKCKGVFTTREKMTASFVIVEKKDGHHMQFAHSKLFASIYRSLIEHKYNDFGSSASTAQDLTQKIEEFLIYKKIKLIKTKDLCKLTFRIIAKNHPDAAIRYYIYFNHHSSVSEYLRQIKKILTV
jgi:transcriptional repressor NrdR